mgnify:CR=1 FL=1
MSELYPGSYQYEPMKYNGKPVQSIIDAAFKADGTWVAQEKRDGALYQLEKIDDDHIYLFARTKSRKTGELVEKSANVPHIIEWAKENLPNDTIVIGEIYVLNGKSNNVTSIMGCTSTNAISRQFKSNAYGGPVYYYIFDCIRFAGENLINKGFLDRWTILCDSNIDVEHYVRLSDVYAENFEEALKEIFLKGGEGMVFKKRDAIYEPGKRPTRTYFKMKEHLDNIDLICIGLEDPVYLYTGKEAETWPYKDNDGNLITKPAYYGWKNAITLGAYKDNKIIEVGRVASGLTDELRKDMAEHPENYLNYVVEVEAMSTTKDGALRHPCFVQMRYDKNIEDCKWEEVFK